MSRSFEGSSSFDSEFAAPDTPTSADFSPSSQLQPPPPSESPPKIMSFSAYLDSKEEAAGSSLTKEQSAALTEFIRRIKGSDTSLKNALL